MSSSSQAISPLPEFVLRLAEQALHEFLSENHAGVILDGHIQRTAIVLFELTPHPLTREIVRLPMALLNWRANHWQLYFRGARGRWLLYPDSPAVRRPEPLLYRVAQDDLGLFWRQ